MAPNPYLKALGGQKAGPESASPASKSKTKKTKKDSTSTAKGQSKPQNDDSGLRKEILALGGDEEDYKLLQGVESESELEESGAEDEDQSKGSKPAKGLLTDLRSFVKGLDFKAAGAKAPDVESEDEEAPVVEDETESDGSESDQSEQEQVETKKVEQPTKPVAAIEKKESKAEREQRRKAEREAEKERERAAKAEERVVKEEKVKISSSRSPWIVDPTPQWYSTPLPSPAPSAARPSSSTVSALLTRGQDLLSRDNALYASSLDPKASSKGSAPPPPTGLSKADQVFVQQILTSGTSSDKVSALLLLVSSSPLHTMSYLDQLASLAKKKSRDESGRALRGIVDWWRGEGGGSPTRKLRAFADQPLLPTVALAYEALETKGKSASSATINREEMERCLAVFAFEDWFKKWFFQILQALEQMSVDPLAHPRSLAVLHLSNLLRDKPEQESNILRLLVNKLGDTQRGIASKTSHHLLQVLQTHPGMTPILVREVASLVLRPRAASHAAPSSGSHVRFGGDDTKKKGSAAVSNPQDQGRDNARYYGIITLNQVMLNKDQNEVAGKMIDVYFEVFGDVLGRLPDKKDDESDGEEQEKKKKEKGQKRKRGEKAEKDGQSTPAAVGEMDSKLVAAVLTGINRAFPFATIDDEAFKQRLDTLFRITHTGTFNVSIQALLLIYHVSAAKRAISDRFYRALYASLFDPRLVSSSKQALYLNLVFRATKHDQDPKRVMAIVKRLLQVLTTMDVTFTLGALYVVGELMSTVPGLREMIAQPESEKIKTAVQSEKKEDSDDKKEWPTAYDGKKREPEFANAQNSCLWELIPLLTHWHPTVALYAESLLTFSPLPVSNDLEQHSLNTFLDRFIYREPKKSVSSKGSSMMQSGLQGQDRSGRVVLVKGSAAKKGEEAFNSDKFRRKNVYDVPADQLFFHKYFTSRTTQEDEKSKATSKRKSRRKGDGDSSDSEESIADAGIAETGEDFDEDALAAAMEEEVGAEDAESDEGSEDDEMEEEIWKAMKKSMPRETGDEDMLGAEDDSEADADEDDEDLAAYDYSDSEDEDKEEEVPYKSPFADEDSDGADDDGFLEEEEDLLDSDQDIPLYGSDDDDEEEAEAKSSKAGNKNKKRKLKHLPLFATADDYAKLLGGSDDEDI
ncbi:hypothetical protein JCM3765_002898 [Sporobolomyces pararoseus]